MGAGTLTMCHNATPNSPTQSRPVDFVWVVVAFNALPLRIGDQGCRGYGDSHGYGYGDYDESPWVCGDSMGIFEWIPNYVETS